MTKARVIEPEGVTGEFTVESYDHMMRALMEKGYLDTSQIIKAGIISGTVLEIGPGPGYLGIDWLRKTTNTFLKGLDVSADMIAAASRNAREFAVAHRVEYVLGNANHMLFGDNTFDAVFSNGSLHEWSDPQAVLNEIYRVLKPGGRYCVTDLRRDITLFARAILQFAIPKERKHGFLSSLNASYTQTELGALVRDTKLSSADIGAGLWTVSVAGRK
ncbi:MAG TPA: class I SAM-dependent methyltransferase [Anaerolineales bacterium]|nr:class I SAM-dependent methyltransferase [Anaerolineales bacterium]